MGFHERHPYLFWQLIGWGLVVGDFLFLVVCALCDFGEWCYPVLVFTFIGALFIVSLSPIIVRFSRSKAVPQSEDKLLERFIRTKISAVNAARRSKAKTALILLSVFGSMFVFTAAAYYLGKYVNLALGFAGLVMMAGAPLVIILCMMENGIRRFFSVKNAEKLIDLVQPPDLNALSAEDMPTLAFGGEPPAAFLNFLYNWLKYYLRGERLTFYRVAAPDLCKDFCPSDGLSYENVLFCIPVSQLDLLNGKEERFRKECHIMNAVPFNYLVKSDDEMYGEM